MSGIMAAPREALRTVIEVTLRLWTVLLTWAAIPLMLITAAVAGKTNTFLDRLPDWAYVPAMLCAWLPAAMLAYRPRSHWARPAWLALAAVGAGLVAGHLIKLITGYLMLVPLAMLLILVFVLLPRLDEPNAELDEQFWSPSGQSEPGREPMAQDLNAGTYSFNWSTPKTGLDRLAGMADLKGEIREVLRNFKGYANGGPVADRNGILLSGPPGNGKSAMAQAVAGELALPLVKVSVQDLTSKWINESSAVIRELFRQAAEQSCVLFIDEFDAVATGRGSGSMHHEDRKVVNTLLSEIDAARRHRMVLVAATNFPEELDAAIVRDGRFDFRIEIPYPDEVARGAILTELLEKHGLKADSLTVQKIARLWERRSIAFIESTVKRIRDSGLSSRRVTVEDFKAASRAASRRSSAIPSTGKKLSELALPAEVRLEADGLAYRLRNWESIAERGGEPPSGILLYGPPGTGKTNLVRALARELEFWHIFEVSASDVIRNPKSFRDTVELASQHRPAFVFIDEADELLRDRGSSMIAGATNEILKTIDGLMGKVPEVVFVAATNAPDLIDAAALRGGRFADKIYMRMLAGEDLESFLAQEISSQKARFDPSLSPKVFAELLGEISAADASSLMRKAVNYTISGQAQRAVEKEDVMRALRAMYS